jgi:hypothetical protein
MTDIRPIEITELTCGRSFCSSGSSARHSAVMLKLFKRRRVPQTKDRIAHRFWLRQGVAAVIFESASACDDFRGLGLGV